MRGQLLNKCLWLVLPIVGSLSLLGCHDLTGSQSLPSGILDPSFYQNKGGAIGMRNAAISQLENALQAYVLDAGLLTDELEDAKTGASQGALLESSGVTDPLDERILLPGVSLPSYGKLQGVRTLATQALGALAAYDTAPADTATAAVMRGELFALEGYSEILLADLFCSGMPLSTLDFGKDFTYAASSTTSQVYQDALGKFDSALVLAKQSDSVMSLARIGQGRAYLALAQYQLAADDVSTVPNEFHYTIAVQWVQVHTGITNPGGIYNAINGSNSDTPVGTTVSDSEGHNGVAFLSSHDPRSAVDTTALPFSINPNFPYIPMTFPKKYAAALTAPLGYAPFTLASGTEARLIAAELALQGGQGSGWLPIVNQLRTSGSATVTVPDTIVDTLGYTGCTSATACDSAGYQVGVNYAAYTFVDSTQITPPDPGPAVDACRANQPGNATYTCDPATVSLYADPAHTHQVTIWQAGTGGVAGLPPLSDPGIAAARVALFFRERAFWFFLDGHRQGDLRRLLRQYGRGGPQLSEFNDQSLVYPTGLYLAPGTGVYGSAVVAPIPPDEAANHNFHGCLNYDP